MLKALEKIITWYNPIAVLLVNGRTDIRHLGFPCLGLKSPQTLSGGHGLAGQHHTMTKGYMMCGHHRSPKLKEGNVFLVSQGNAIFLACSALVLATRHLLAPIQVQRGARYHNFVNATS